MFANFRALSGRLVQTATQLKPFVSAHRVANVFAPDVLELGLASPLVLAYLYQMGNAYRDGDNSHSSRWITSLGEGLVTQGLVQTTKYVYPAVGAGWAAYEMGTAHGFSEKAKAALKAAVLFPVGYIGILLGQGVGDGLKFRDASRIMSQMRPDQAALAASASSGLTPEVTAAINSLGNSTRGLMQLFNASNPRLLDIPRQAQVFHRSQDAFFNAMRELGETRFQALSSGIKTPLQGLVREVGRSQTYGWLRNLNPAFGYLLLTTFVGLPLVKIIAGLTLPKTQKPQWSDVVNDSHVVAPLWMDRVVATLFGGAESGGGHGGAGEHPYLKADGPALLESAWNQSASGGH